MNISQNLKIKSNLNHPKKAADMNEPLTNRTGKIVGEYYVESDYRNLPMGISIWVTATKMEIGYLPDCQFGIGWVVNPPIIEDNRVRYLFNGAWTIFGIQHFNYLMGELKKDLPEEIYDEFQAQTLMMVMKHGGP